MAGQSIASHGGLHPSSSAADRAGFSADPAPEIDSGLGTAYERQAILGLLDRWVPAAKGLAVLEGPGDGMAGIHGVHALGLARQGARVTVALDSARALDLVNEAYAAAGARDAVETLEAVDPARLAPRRWDVGICFNVLPLREDWRDYLRALAARVDRLIVVVTHAYSYGAQLRRALRWFERTRSRELFDHEATRSQILESELSLVGTVTARAWLDCPWWPDLFVPPGESLLSGSLSRLNIPLGRARNPRFDYGVEDLPGAELSLPLRRALRRHPNFEDHPLLGSVFAHHRAYRLDCGHQ